jgi:hypothetical protein
VVSRPKRSADNLFITSRTPRTTLPLDSSSSGESEVSETAQIKISSLVPPDDSLEVRFRALCQVLVTKGIITEAELAEALRKPETKPES